MGWGAIFHFIHHLLFQRVAILQNEEGELEN